jgi:TolB-like protein/Flp pilus assembly protein TadD
LGLLGYLAGGRGGQDAGEAGADASIAVLPFVNMSPDPEQEYFSDGITEDLLTMLSQVERLRVISRTSVMRYKGTELAIPQIARQLGVSHVLEGSVRREENRVRITAQLIDARTDTHLWAETYDRELAGVFRVQTEIAQQIADALRRRLAPERLAGGGTPHFAAYDLLLRGREYLHRPGDADLRKFAPAMSFFRRALALDPGYARAYAGLSEAFRLHVALPEQIRRDSALAYARRAVAADPELAEAAAALGAAYALADDRVRAREQFRRALDLDPNRADARAGHARLAALDGRLDQAARWQRRAVEVDPTSAVRWTELGAFLLDLGDLDGAGAAFTRGAELAPDYPDAHYLLAQVHLIRGDSTAADATMQALLTAAADHPGSRLLMARHEAARGRLDAAERYLHDGPGLGFAVVVRALIARRRGDDRNVAALLGGLEARLAAAGTLHQLSPRGLLHARALLGDLDGALEVIAAHWRTGLRGSTGDPPEIGVYFLDHVDMLETLREDARFLRVLSDLRLALDSMRALPP